MRKAIFSLALVVILLVGSGAVYADGPACTQSGDDGSASGPSSMSPSTSSCRISVAIRNNRFNPTSITVWQGTTVTWMNQDTIAHTVTSDDMKNSTHFDSGTLQPDQNYSYTFSQTGVYTYHCAIHPEMTGSVNVINQPQQPTTSPTPNPSPSSGSSSGPSVSSQASANATVNNYNYSGPGYGCTNQRTSPSIAAPTNYHTTPDYSQAMNPIYKPPKASVSAPVSTPETTEQALPSTGPAGTVAIAAAATSIGTGGSYFYLLKRKKLS